jgi:iron complex outermembrane receptor protein
LAAFHSWIQDYNTYAAFAVDPLTGARFLAAQNTPLATLKGFEMYTDYNYSENMILFGTLQYVEGQDVTLNQPLPAIYPMESRLGLRVIDDNQGQTWGVEWGWRLVAAQNRVGMLRNNLFDLPGVVPVEQRTGGFATSYIRSYYNYSQNTHFIAGIDNLFNRKYVEHLDNRLGASPNPPNPNFGPIAAFAPGFTAYGGVEFNW